MPLSQEAGQHVVSSAHLQEALLLLGHDSTSEPARQLTVHQSNQSALALVGEEQDLLPVL